MAYGSQPYGGGGYQKPQGQFQSGGYSKTPYQAPPRKEFNLEDEANKYGIVYLTLVEQLKAVGVSIEDVKDYLGGWTTSLKMNLDKSGM